MTHKPIRGSHELRQRARDLRQEQTKAEIIWHHLRGRKNNGLKFRRQHPIECFIVDFYCAEHQLVVEVDDPIHHEQSEHDQLRTAWLEERGYSVIRFTNSQVIQDIDAVLEAIVQACTE
ncbi:MAG: DUF559 domain-containing protein [Chloroflexota bacterium]